MSRIANQIKFFNASSHFDQMDVLGLTAPKKGILFYEDHAAYLFTKTLVKASPLFVMDSFFYHKSGSDGDVWTDLQRFPVSVPDFSFIAVFDGDCRGKYDRKLHQFQNYIFLPSNLSPEEHLIEYLNKIDETEIANYLGKDMTNLTAAKEVAAGLDHHDYFVAMAKTLGIHYDDLFTKLCDLWVSDPSNSVDVKAFLDKLEKITQLD